MRVPGLGYPRTYELSSKLLKGGYIGDYIGTIVGVIKGDTRSLDYGSYGGFTEGLMASHGQFTNFQVGDMDGLKFPLQHIMAFRIQGQRHAAPCHLIWVAVKERF